VSAAPPAVSLSRVTVAWRTRRLFSWRTEDVVRGVSLELAAGECFGLVGESGCGKSTLARAVAGLVPLREGRIRVAGVPDGPPRARRAALRRQVQMIFQDAAGALNPRLTAGYQLREAHGLGRQRREDPRDATAAMLDRVGLPREVLGRYPHELSGGQRQRVVIARALLTGAGILLADEPVSSLDLSVQAQILEVLRGLHRDAGLTCLFISHDLDVVRYLCSRVAVMHDGRIVEEGPASRVLAAPAHPCTRALLDTIPYHMRPFRDGGDPPAPSAPPAPSGCSFRLRCPVADLRCAAETPPLIPLGEGHRAACFKPRDPGGRPGTTDQAQSWPTRSAS